MTAAQDTLRCGVPWVTSADRATTREGSCGRSFGAGRMSERRTSGGVAVGASIIVGALLLLGSSLAYIGWYFGSSTYAMNAAPNALVRDQQVITLAKKALRLHGLNPSSCRPCSYADGAIVGRNALDASGVCTYWLTPTGTFGVNLEQRGSQVVCEVARFK